ncbi:hypothetical protein HDU76_009958 [Blyttiomyces sp. JEL0837]|nr:hypothetical protein HDU76_009958 [Blyttiomyces sp. JEL0837]
MTVPPAVAANPNHAPPSYEDTLTMTQYFEDQRIAAIKPESSKDHFSFKPVEDQINTSSSTIQSSDVVERIVKGHIPPVTGTGSSSINPSSSSASVSSNVPIYHAQFHQNQNVNGIPPYKPNATTTIDGKPIVQGPHAVVAVPAYVAINNNNGSNDPNNPNNNKDTDLLFVTDNSEFDLHCNETRFGSALLIIFYVLLVQFPLALFNCVWILVTFSLSVSLLVIPILGVPLFIGSAFTWRAMAWLDLRIYRQLLLYLPISHPLHLSKRDESIFEFKIMPTLPPKPSLWTYFKQIALTVFNFKAFVHYAIINFVIAIVNFTIKAQIERRSDEFGIGIGQNQLEHQFEQHGWSDLASKKHMFLDSDELVGLRNGVQAPAVYERGDDSSTSTTNNNNTSSPTSSFRRFILQFHPRANATGDAVVKKQHQDFLALVKQNGLCSHVLPAAGYDPIFTFFSGLVVDVHGEDVDRRKTLAALQGFEEVMRIMPVNKIPMPKFKVHHVDDNNDSTTTTQNPKPNLKRKKKRDDAANNLTDVSEVISNYGRTKIVGQVPGSIGTGVRLCIIDTGVDYTHPALGGCFGPVGGCRVVFGYDLVGDNYDPSSQDPAKLIPNPGNNPMDCAGHGTHVVGIAAAIDVEKRGASGVAPGATIGVYRVFGCQGNTDNAIIISAMQRAYSDGCNIINLSLGGGPSWFDTPDANVASTLEEAGVIIVAAAGNDQRLGLFRVGSPAISKTSTAVAAVENSRYFGRTLTITNVPSSRSIPFAFPVGKPPSPNFDGKLKATEPLSDSVTSDGCNPFSANYFGGYIALIRRGTCLFTTKISNAYRANASAIIVYNNLPGPLGEIPAPLANFPVLTVSGDDGSYLISLLKSQGNGNISVAFGQSDVVFSIASNGTIADFSSWGLSPDWDVKAMKLGRYAVLSGTSMSSPHLAGIYALYLARLGSYSPRSVSPSTAKAALMTTAHPTNMNVTTTYLAPVGLQGAGLVNASAALLSTTLLSPTSFAAGVTPWQQDGTPIPVAFNLTIKNLQNQATTFKVSFQEAGIVNIYDAYAPVIAPPKSGQGSTFVIADTPSFTVPPYQSVTIGITIRGPDRTTALSIAPSTAWMYSGYVILSEDNCSKRLFVPFAGTVGDFSKLRPVDTTTNDPFISTLTEPAKSNRPVNVVFQQTSLLNGGSGDLLLVNLHMLLPSPNAAISVFPSNFTSAAALDAALNAFPQAAAPVGAVAFAQGVRIPMTDPDNNSGNLYAIIPWDGTDTFVGGKRVASGQYLLVAVVEGVYAEAGLVSAWTSPVFTATWI